MNTSWMLLVSVRRTCKIAQLISRLSSILIRRCWTDSTLSKLIRFTTKKSDTPKAYSSSSVHFSLTCVCLSRVKHVCSNVRLIGTISRTLQMPDEEAFCVLVRLMKSYDLRSHYTPNMPGLQLRLFQFDRLLEELLPGVFMHLLRQGIKSSMYASQWFLTLFG